VILIDGDRRLTIFTLLTMEAPEAMELIHVTFGSLISAIDSKEVIPPFYGINFDQKSI
jgi:hypothetical protein